MVRKRILKGIFETYRMNYLTEFDLYIDIVQLMFIFFFVFLWHVRFWWVILCRIFLKIKINGFKYCNLTLIILFPINHKFAHILNGLYFSYISAPLR